MTESTWQPRYHFCKRILSVFIGYISYDSGRRARVKFTKFVLDISLKMTYYHLGEVGIDRRGSISPVFGLVNNHRVYSNPICRSTRKLTVALSIIAKDGIVVACDSLTTFGRGVPVTRYTNKVYVIKHDNLESPVVVAGAGATAFVDKFLERAKMDVIDYAFKEVKRKLDIVDFSERVCEPTISALFREYVIDRQKYFGGGYSGEYSISLLVAGAARDKSLRSYIVYDMGLSEAISECGTIGSGAAYAELFLRNLMPNPGVLSVDDAACLAAYVVKGVEIMDPYVGGQTNVCTLKFNNNTLEVKQIPKSKIPVNAKMQMEKALQQFGDAMRNLTKLRINTKKNGGKPNAEAH